MATFYPPKVSSFRTRKNVLSGCTDGTICTDIKICTEKWTAEVPASPQSVLISQSSLTSVSSAGSSPAAIISHPIKSQKEFLIEEVEVLRKKVEEEKKKRASLEWAIQISDIPFPDIQEKEEKFQLPKIEAEVKWLGAEMEAAKKHLSLLRQKGQKMREREKDEARISVERRRSQLFSALSDEMRMEEEWTRAQCGEAEERNSQLDQQLREWQVREKREERRSFEQDSELSELEKESILSLVDKFSTAPPQIPSPRKLRGESCPEFFESQMTKDNLEPLTSHPSYPPVLKSIRTKTSANSNLPPPKLAARRRLAPNPLTNLTKWPVLKETRTELKGPSIETDTETELETPVARQSSPGIDGSKSLNNSNHKRNSSTNRMLELWTVNSEEYERGIVLKGNSENSENSSRMSRRPISSPRSLFVGSPTNNILNDFATGSNEGDCTNEKELSRQNSFLSRQSTERGHSFREEGSWSKNLFSSEKWFRRRGKTISDGMKQDDKTADISDEAYGQDEECMDVKRRKSVELGELLGSSKFVDSFMDSDDEDDDDLFPNLENPVSPSNGVDDGKWVYPEGHEEESVVEVKKGNRTLKKKGENLWSKVKKSSKNSAKVPKSLPVSEDMRHQFASRRGSTPDFGEEIREAFKNSPLLPLSNSNPIPNSYFYHHHEIDDSIEFEDFSGRPNELSEEILSCLSSTLLHYRQNQNSSLGLTSPNTSTPATPKTPNSRGFLSPSSRNFAPKFLKNMTLKSYPDSPIGSPTPRHLGFPSPKFSHTSITNDFSTEYSNSKSEDSPVFSSSQLESPRKSHQQRRFSSSLPTFLRAKKSQLSERTEIISPRLNLGSSFGLNVSKTNLNSFTDFVTDPYNVSEGHPSPADLSFWGAVEIKYVPSKKNIDPIFVSNQKRYRALMEQLKKVDPKVLSHEQKLAFWINIYNSLIMQECLQYGPASSAPRWLSRLARISCRINGQKISTAEIEYSLLRARSCESSMSKSLKIRKFEESDPRSEWALDHPEPLVTFALAPASRSSPALRVYRPETIHETLEESKNQFLRLSIGFSPTGHLVIPKILDWYCADFAVDEGTLAEWVKRQAPRHQERRVRECIEAATSGSHLVHVAPYDWTFRYLLEPQRIFYGTESSAEL